MAHAMIHTGALDLAVLEVLTAERKKALSAREWKFRIAGFGYGIKEEGEQRIVTQLRNGSELGVLPAGIC
ncbi:hypothetical protein [Albibacillus kandeliae]|uniref:hypothetical protein n=1 Tax=Albibacillus kandeliae TaxID=2174228 RepID=UPI001E43F254|nr:hypothetical protein [Albibacillus kandeliae]